MRTKLREIRKEMNMNTYQFAEFLGCSKSYINDLENGKKFPSRKMLERFAQILKVKPKELIVDDD